MFPIVPSSHCSYQVRTVVVRFSGKTFQVNGHSIGSSERSQSDENDERDGNRWSICTAELGMGISKRLFLKAYEGGMRCASNRQKIYLDKVQFNWAKLVTAGWSQVSGTGALPGRTSRAVCMPAVRAASSSAGMSLQNRISLGFSS